MEGAKIQKLEDIRRYLLAGSAVFTLVSLKTNQRKTFRVEANEDGAFFVSLLVGPSNTDDFKYLCFLYPTRDTNADPVPFFKLKANRDGWGEEAFRTFDWLLRRLNATRNIKPQFFEAENKLFNTQAEFWHSGRCSKCSRQLTDPESIARGLGPICAEASDAS